MQQPGGQGCEIRDVGLRVCPVHDGVSAVGGEDPFGYSVRHIYAQACQTLKANGTPIQPLSGSRESQGRQARGEGQGQPTGSRSGPTW